MVTSRIVRPRPPGARDLRKLRGEYNVLNYALGVNIGDGASHPLSGLFATLGAAQAVYPHATSLTNELAWAAIQAAINAAKGTPNGQGTYVANGAVVIPGGTYLVNRSIDVRSVYGLILTGASGPYTTYIKASSIPAHTIGVTTTGGAILRINGLYNGQVRNLHLLGDGACHGMMLNGLPALAAPTGPTITLVAGAGTPANFVAAQTYYVCMTLVTGSNGETPVATNFGTYVMPETPNPIQINMAFAPNAYDGGLAFRFYIGETNVAANMRYVGQSTVYNNTVTNMLTVLDPTGIAHPVSGVGGAAPPTAALTGGLATTNCLFEHVVAEGPFGAGKHALWIGSDRFQADQCEYIRCKFDGGSAKNSGDLVFIEDANAVIHNFYGCVFYRSGAKGVVCTGGTGGSFNLVNCGFTANVDWDIETYPGSRGYNISGCWSESSSRFLNLTAGGTNNANVTPDNCSVNTFTDPSSKMIQVNGCGVLNIIGGVYKSGTATPARIAVSLGTALRADVNVVGATFDGNPFADTSLTIPGTSGIHVTGMRIRLAGLSAEAETLDGYVPRGSIATPLAYGTDLAWAPAAWLKIPSGTVLAAGLNTFNGIDRNCKGYTGITVDAIHALGGLVQPFTLVAKDTASSTFQLSLIVGSGFTLTSDLVFRLTFRPDPVTL